MRRIILFMFLLAFLLFGFKTNKNDAKENYVLVFSEDFKQADGSLPDTSYWSTSPRGWSTWNRWISKSRQVSFIRNGKLVCRAIRNTAFPADTARMLTGAVETCGKFSFQYGKIEVRAKTNLHEGNFPAIWLMPEPPAPQHPDGGEIDIFESFGTHRDAYQTAHTRWTLSKKESSKNSFIKTYFSVNRWHVYGLEWTPTNLVFLIDGEVAGVYSKSSDKKALDGGQWPFDRPFYLILNQSVRQHGASFGGNPDLNYVYETEFDWVRVYQYQR